MKHLRKISVVEHQRIIAREAQGRIRGLGVADAKTDWSNAMWRDFNNFVDAKKNETRVQ